MKIYVAGKWNDSQTINEVQNILISQGHSITHDWTKNEGSKNITEMTNEEKIEFKRNCADLDIEGVKNCDLLIAIMNDPSYAYRGTFTEIGCALGLSKKVIIVCPDESYLCCSNCFFYHSNIIHVKTIEDVWLL